MRAVSSIFTLFLSVKWAFSFGVSTRTSHHASTRPRSPSCEASDSSAETTAPSSLDQLETLKAELVKTCRKSPKASREEIRTLVSELEIVAEQAGVGQSSSFSGLLNGEWELLYSPEDETRSSPFFWAFQKAFPDNSDQIFGITDAIPSPMKEIGPAYQEIDMSETQSGTFVSRVKVATLGGMATSIMTTRATIVGADGVDGIRLKIDTTKPEDSTIVKTFLGPLGDVFNENSPPFPSGEALERVSPGSSEIILRTTFCDEGLRISRNGERPSDIFVWKRRKFGSYETIL